MIAAIAVLVASFAGPCWSPPVAVAPTQPFRAAICRWCPGHQALGYRLAAGSPVTAVAAGTVEFAGVVAGVAYVTIGQAEGWRATYGGLHPVTVREGSRVTAGQRLGVTTTWFTFSLRHDSQYVDPAPMLGRWRGRLRLLPTDRSPPRRAGPPRLVCPARPSDR